MRRSGMKCCGALGGGATKWEVKDGHETRNLLYYSHGFRLTENMDQGKWFDIDMRRFIESDNEIAKLNALLIKWSEFSDQDSLVYNLERMVHCGLFLICTHCGCIVSSPRNYMTVKSLARKAVKKGWTYTSGSQYGTTGIYCPKCSEEYKDKPNELTNDCGMERNRCYDYGDWNDDGFDNDDFE